MSEVAKRAIESYLKTKGVLLQAHVCAEAHFFYAVTMLLWMSN